MKQVQELKEYCYDVIGAIHEVHQELGAGLNEYIYQEGHRRAKIHHKTL